LFGTLSLSYFFKQAGVQDWFFCGLFHAISAFCNAGFSLFSNNLEGYVYNVPVIVIIMLLIVTGGLGFIVLQDIANVLQKKKRYLTYHSRVVLAMTALLIIPGTVFFLLVERTRAYKDLPFGLAVIQAMFQTITPRTAGFDSIAQNLLSQPSKIITILYMFIGAAPGSIAGGIKVTTAFVVGSVMLRRPDKNGDIRFRHHRLVAETINNGIVFFLKALLLLLSSAMALSIIEGLHGQDFDSIVFEVVSAFGTVGLSLGLTPQLSVMGKLIIIATMFAGRVGLVALAFPGPYKKEYPINYPEGKVLLG
jgi:trk system potassium uptake protein TrkH